jgi:prepilin-type N-terminal cleavage/methylation domain-containing protein
MKKDCSGVTLIELAIVVIIISIIVTFSIPILSKTLIALRTRSAAETLVTQLYQARQAAINFGRRNEPLSLYMYPPGSGRGYGLWFDRDNRDIAAPGTIPSTGVVFLPQAIFVGNDISATPACSGTPFKIVEFNSRGEIKIGFLIDNCLKNNPAGTRQAMSIYVESTKGTRAISRYIVGISLLGSISVSSR